MWPGTVPGTPRLRLPLLIVPHSSRSQYFPGKGARFKSCARSVSAVERLVPGLLRAGSENKNSRRRSDIQCSVNTESDAKMFLCHFNKHVVWRLTPIQLPEGGIQSGFLGGRGCRSVKRSSPQIRGAPYLLFVLPHPSRLWFLPAETLLQ